MARAYGESTSLLAIDDLKVEYIEDGAPTLDLIRNQLITPEDNSQNSIGEGWTRIKGSFTTPPETVAYEGIEGTVQKEVAGAGGFTKKATVDDTAYNVSVTLPEGEKFVYGSIQTKSNPAKSSSKYYQVRWTLNGSAYWAYSSGYWKANDQENLESYNLPHSFDFILPSSWSNPVLEVRKWVASSGFGSSGAMSDIITATVRQTDDNTADRRYFLELPGETDDGAILTENLRFSGDVTVGFSAGGEKTEGISNLKIYTIRDSAPPSATSSLSFAWSSASSTPAAAR